ncbi:hypothetical protein BpHYR1_037165 [Brachionus plicatilis]|uniref:Uncharacterized protein n=1 Tax=Brachionus plicatilis TaxID=10195 RepID=A0A3M7RFC4_BRAPC|nr:hypothetical protein BpHYR1_037165 [Brachionus plicatilis]
MSLELSLFLSMVKSQLVTGQLDLSSKLCRSLLLTGILGRPINLFHNKIVFRLGFEFKQLKLMLWLKKSGTICG